MLPLVVLSAWVLGCHSSPWASQHTPSEQAMSSPSAAQRAEATPPVAANPANPVAAPQGPDPQAMQDVIAQIQNLKDLDPATREQLLADLQKTDARYWPEVVHQLQATLTYRQKAQHRESQPTPEAAPALTATSAPLAAPLPSPAPAMAPTSPLLGPSAMEAVAPAMFQGKTVSALSAVLASAEMPLPESVPSPAATAEGSKPGASAQAPAPAEETKVVAAAYETPSGEAGWRDELQQAIRALEAKVPAAPESAEEVAEHARLRMLYLLAGRREDALRPIPAASPSVQDFWSKELFGLATWLDTQHLENPEARAAESRQHLGEALVSLGQSSKLLVRNMAFATKIDGYGDYRPFAESKFAPGQEVLVYAELENFRSEPTAAGYATSLSVSWQIFDGGGHRVATGEAKSDEVCRSLRHDFYISYPLFLPDRIYSGPHKFQLTVEDLKSQKIGQQTIDFTVVEGSK